MRKKNHVICLTAWSFSSTLICCTKFQKLSILSHERQFSATPLLRRAYAQKLLFINFQWNFLHQHFIPWHRFPLIFYMLKVRYISTSGLFIKKVYKAYTRLDPDDDNFHQVWSWYDCLTDCLAADTFRDLVTLTLDLLTLNSCHTWLVTWSYANSFLSSLVNENVFYWTPLKMRIRGHCAWAESRNQ